MNAREILWWLGIIGIILFIGWSHCSGVADCERQVCPGGMKPVYVTTEYSSSCLCGPGEKR